MARHAPGKNAARRDYWIMKNATPDVKARL
jgi:hypothetical protein